jgi:hypothetical protein
MPTPSRPSSGTPPSLAGEATARVRAPSPCRFWIRRKSGRIARDSAQDDLDGLRDTAQLQPALRGDFEIVASYGEEHPEAWAGAWWDNEPTVRIVAAFTGDAAQHDAALRPRLRHPGRLVVESRQHSLSELRRVREEIERTLRQRQTQTGRPILASVGNGKAVISVALRADQEQVASELASRYGSAVELRVGNFAFPGCRRTAPHRPAAGRLPAELLPRDRGRLQRLGRRHGRDHRSRAPYPDHDHPQRPGTQG